MLLIINNLKLIFSQKRTYIILGTFIGFMLSYFTFDGCKRLEDLFYIYSNNILLWLVTIPIIIAINKPFIYSISYVELIRVGSKEKDLLYSYITIFISTFFICVCLLVVPVIILLCGNIVPLREYTFFYLIFFFIRYYLVALFTQYLIKLIMLISTRLQRNNASIYFLPVILYFVLTMPFEYFRSSCQSYIIQIEFGTASWLLSKSTITIKTIFIESIFLICYIFILIYMSIEILKKYMEYEQNEKENSY